MRALAPESVLAMKPDLIVAVEGSGPKEAMDVLTAAEVPIVIVPEPHSAAGIAEKIALIGDAIGAPDKATALATEVEATSAALATAIAAIPEESAGGRCS